jgi:hypothetical protein
MAETQSPPVNVPECEVARQATDALGGYVYQLHQTVLAWLALARDELLYIEVAEDFAVSNNLGLHFTQVKKTKSRITARSKGVAKLITAVWNFQTSNPSRKISAVFLTTSRIGKELRITFPGNVPGLAYWRIAARARSNVEPIRIALLTLDISRELKAFISEATEEELRTRIICPIRWLDAGATQDELDRDIEERLVLFGSRQGVAAEASKNVLDSLVGALLRCVRKPTAQRYVTAAELLETFQSKTFVSVPPGLLEGLTIPLASSPLTEIGTTTRDLAQSPLPPRVVPRTEEVDRLQTILVSRGKLWLHGSSGLGKTTLALLLARSQRVSWRFADLRDVPPSTVRSVLFGIATSFRQSGARGVILDDISADPDNALSFAIGQAARAVADADGLLIITSTKSPPPTLSGRLELNADAIIQVPYLTEADVAQIVRLGGGDSKKWARSIWAFAGGHPQLVDARVAGLKTRGWDEKEMLAGIVPLKNVPDDMEEERKAVRGRLLQDLEPNATELLLRLSLLLGNFDRPMALVAGNTPAPIAQVGLVFDFLVGPWIEHVGPERYRLSPLLKDSGSVGLADSLKDVVKSNILNHLIVQRPFPADQLFQVFSIAAQQNDRQGLGWFAAAVLGASAKPKESQFKRLAQAVSPFALADRGEGVLLFPGDPHISATLRLAQLRVAVATEQLARAAALVDRAFFENSFAKKDDRQYLDTLISATVMLESRIPVPPRRWLGMLLDLVATSPMKDILSQHRPTTGLFGGVLETVSNDEMMFIVRASALRGAGELAELIDALEQKPKVIRDRYIGATARTTQSLHLVVAGSWLAEVKRPDFDARAAAAVYHSLSETRTSRDNPDLAVELLCAEAIMLDEYAEDRDSALEVLRVAQEAYPNDYRLNRQRQKVFYRNSQHADALAEFEKFCDRMPKERALDRAYALREAGSSAAEVGDLDKTRVFFEQAWEASRACGATMGPMTAGLSADCAILDFDAGKAGSALDLMRRALVEADGLDPRSGLKESFVRRIHIAAILYMRGAAQDFPAARQLKVIGMCSNPAPSEWFRSQPQPQPTFVWYLLAELEAETSVDQTVLAELRERTKAGGLLPMEAMLVVKLAEAAIRALDVGRFLELLKTYPRAIKEGISKLRGWGGGDVSNQPVGHLAPIAESEWRDASISEATKRAVLSFMLACGAGGRGDVMTVLRQEIVRTSGLAEDVDALFRFVDEPSQEEGDVYIIIPSIVGRLLKSQIVDTNDAFFSAVYLLQFLDNDVLGAVTAEAMMSFYERLWVVIAERRAFSMRSPTTNAPFILEAIHKGDTALQRMANMVLSAEAAVKRNLPSALRERFARIAAKRVRAASTSEE